MSTASFHRWYDRRPSRFSQGVIFTELWSFPSVNAGHSTSKRSPTPSTFDSQHAAARFLTHLEPREPPNLPPILRQFGMSFLKKTPLNTHLLDDWCVFSCRGRTHYDGRNEANAISENWEIKVPDFVPRSASTPLAVSTLPAPLFVIAAATFPGFRPPASVQDTSPW